MSKTFRVKWVSLRRYIPFLLLAFTLGMCALLMQSQSKIDPCKIITVRRSQSWKNSASGVVNCISRAIEKGIMRSLTDLDTVIAINGQHLSSKETAAERKSAFEEIFKNKLWKGQNAPDSERYKIVGSGPGSTLAKSVNITATLDTVISEVKAILGKSVITMLDIPCGDLTWMSVLMANRTDVKYTGMDIVPDIVQHHSQIYSSNYPHMTFINQDIVAAPLHQKYDLIHTRQMTQHLTTEDTIRVINHFKESGSHFLLATTVPTVGPSEINLKCVGRHRLQNLQAPPISLPYQFVYNKTSVWNTMVFGF